MTDRQGPCMGLEFSGSPCLALPGHSTACLHPAFRFLKWFPILKPECTAVQAVEDAHMALFYNMGQCCAAGSRYAPATCSGGTIGPASVLLCMMGAKEPYTCINKAGHGLIRLWGRGFGKWGVE